MLLLKFYAWLCKRTYFLISYNLFITKLKFDMHFWTLHCSNFIRIRSYSLYYSCILLVSFESHFQIKLIVYNSIIGLKIVNVSEVEIFLWKWSKWKVVIPWNIKNFFKKIILQFQMQVMTLKSTSSEIKCKNKISKIFNQYSI